MKKNGVKYLQLVSVDNVMTKLADPRMVGFLVANDFLICSKFTKKVKDDEKVGVHVNMGGKPMVAEYSEIPDVHRK